MDFVLVAVVQSFPHTFVFLCALPPPFFFCTLVQGERLRFLSCWRGFICRSSARFGNRQYISPKKPFLHEDGVGLACSKGVRPASPDPSLPLPFYQVWLHWLRLRARRPSWPGAAAPVSISRPRGCWVRPRSCCSLKGCPRS